MSEYANEYPQYAIFKKVKLRKDGNVIKRKGNKRERVRPKPVGKEII